MSTENNIINSMLNDGTDFMNPDYTGASAEAWVNKFTNRPEDAGTLEGVQTMLGGLGILADPFDWVNASIYAAQGDTFNAALYGSGVGILGTIKLGKFAKQKIRPELLNYPTYEKGTKVLDNLEVIKKLRLHSVDPKIVNEAKDYLKAEILTPESYMKWKQMMDLSKTKSSLRISNYNEYVQTITKIIDDTPVVTATVKNLKDLYKLRNFKSPGAFSIHRIGGLYAPSSHGPTTVGATYIKQSLLKNKDDLMATIVHELKHSVQNPFSRNMDEAYQNIVNSYNISSQLTNPFAKGFNEVMKFMKLPVNTRNKVINAAQSRFNRYVIKPKEVSARLSEIRAGLGSQAQKDLFTSQPKLYDTFSVFNPLVKSAPLPKSSFPSLDQLMWGAVPMGAVTKNILKEDE